MQKLIDLYLDYVNNFLTVARFAEYYGLTEADANTVIKLGKKYNEKLAEIKKVCKVQ